MCKGRKFQGNINSLITDMNSYYPLLCSCETVKNVPSVNDIHASQITTSMTSEKWLLGSRNSRVALLCM